MWGLEYSLRITLRPFDQNNTRPGRVGVQDMRHYYYGPPVGGIRRPIFDATVEIAVGNAHAPNTNEFHFDRSHSSWSLGGAVTAASTAMTRHGVGDASRKSNQKVICAFATLGPVAVAGPACSRTTPVIAVRIKSAAVIGCRLDPGVTRASSDIFTRLFNFINSKNWLFYDFGRRIKHNACCCTM